MGTGRAASKLFVFVLHYFVRPQLATADDAGRLDGNSKLLSTQMATKGSHGAALEMESVARSEMQHLVAQTGPAGLQMMKERESSRQTRRLRLLGLHGWRTSGEVLTKQLAMAGWDRALGDLIEVIPMDAPHPASGPTPPDVELFFGKKQYYEWWDAERGEDGKFHFTGWAESKLAVESFLRDHGPFDGFLGFSQGGIHASSLLAMQQNGRVSTFQHVCSTPGLLAGRNCGMIRLFLKTFSVSLQPISYPFVARDTDSQSRDPGPTTQPFVSQRRRPEMLLRRCRRLWKESRRCASRLS